MKNFSYTAPRVVRVPSSALSENSTLRYITFVLLYFSQGIPEGITLFAIPAWLAMNGKSAAEIAGYSAVILIPFSLKILLAPIMERYTYLPMGRRRPWLLLGQFGILCGLVAFSFIKDPLDNLFQLTVVALCVHVSIMFQDIATDSLVIDITPLDQQGRANSLMWGSKTIGTSVSLFAGTWLIERLGFPSAVLIMSISIFLIMFIPVLLRERTGEKRLPWTPGNTSLESALLAIDNWGKLFSSFLKVVVLRNTILLVLTIFLTMLSVHFLVTMLPIFTIQELHWDNMDYSKVFSFFSLVGGIIGMFIGGVFIQKFGVPRLVEVSFILSAVLAIVMGLSGSLWLNRNYVMLLIAIYCTLRTLVYIGAIAMAMQVCWKRISAVQFTFCMTVFNAGLSAGAALFGFLQSRFPSQVLFFVSALIIIVSLLVFRSVDTSKYREQVDELERNYLKVLEEEGTLMVKAETS